VLEKPQKKKKRKIAKTTRQNALDRIPNKHHRQGEKVNKRLLSGNGESKGGTKNADTLKNKKKKRPPHPLRSKRKLVHKSPPQQGPRLVKAAKIEDRKTRLGPTEKGPPAIGDVEST